MQTLRVQLADDAALAKELERDLFKNVRLYITNTAAAAGAVEHLHLRHGDARY